jgi:uncharacterized membrane protein YfcA
VNSLAGLLAAVAKGASVPPYLPWLAAAVVLGGWLGAEYGAKRFANPVIRRMLALVVALAGAKMIVV